MATTVEKKEEHLSYHPRIIVHGSIESFPKHGAISNSASPIYLDGQPVKGRGTVAAIGNPHKNSRKERRVITHTLQVRRN